MKEKKNTCFSFPYFLLILFGSKEIEVYYTITRIVIVANLRHPGWHQTFYIFQKRPFNSIEKKKIKLDK